MIFSLIKKLKKKYFDKFFLKGQRGNFWVLGQATIAQNMNFYDLIFEATIGSGFLGNIAIDDVEFVRGGTCEFFNSTTTTQPTTTLLPPTAYACDFEANFCEWYVDPAVNSKWQRQNGQSSVFGSAPLSDVTNQNSLGYYAIVSPVQNQFSTAVLKSPALNYNKEACLEFWYQLGGSMTSALSIGVRDRNSRLEVWKRNGNRADTWSHAYVRLPNNTVDKWVEFEGDMPGGYKGYVAIDNIQVIVGSCPTSQFCDFESPDICNYRHDVTANFKWTRNRGGTDSSGTGPSSDHTYQTSEGYYMYIETSYPQKLGDKARLISERIKNKPGGICLNFWYHAYGLTIGQLNIYTRKGTQLSDEPIWAIRGNQGNQWRTAAITVKETEDYEVSFFNY